VRVDQLPWTVCRNHTLRTRPSLFLLATPQAQSSHTSTSSSTLFSERFSAFVSDDKLAVLSKGVVQCIVLSNHKEWNIKPQKPEIPWLLSCKHYISYLIGPTRVDYQTAKSGISLLTHALQDTRPVRIYVLVNCVQEMKGDTQFLQENSKANECNGMWKNSGCCQGNDWIASCTIAMYKPSC